MTRDILKNLWCEWTHGGGHIERDPLGQINWQCAKCGRWSDHPVPVQTERQVVAAHASRMRRDG